MLFLYDVHFSSPFLPKQKGHQELREIIITSPPPPPSQPFPLTYLRKFPINMLVEKKPPLPEFIYLVVDFFFLQSPPLSIKFLSPPPPPEISRPPFAPPSLVHTCIDPFTGAFV